MTLIMDCDRPTSFGGQEIGSFPEAARLVAAQSTGHVVFNLTRPPDINWPVRLLDIQGRRFATNGIASLLCLSADRVELVGGGSSTCWTQPADDLDVEADIYGRATGLMGQVWAARLAEASHNLVYERQQRLELLHCMALRLSDEASTAALGQLIDRVITDMAMPPLKATGRASGGSGHVH